LKVKSLTNYSINNYKMMRFLSRASVGVTLAATSLAMSSMTIRPVSAHGTELGMEGDDDHDGDEHEHRALE
jgi:hypothetical protein